MMKKLLLLFTMLLLLHPAWAQRTGRTTVPPAPKKVLDHSVYDNWKSIAEAQISDNGEWAVYAINPQEGDGRLVIENLKRRTVDTVSRGYGARISADAAWVVFRIKPQLLVLKEMRRQKKKKEDMPKDTLAIFNLATRQLTKIANVKSFMLPEKGTEWLAWHHEPVPPPKPAATPKDSTQAAAPRKVPKRENDENGSKLVVRNLKTGHTAEFAYVTAYALSNTGAGVAWVSTGSDSTYLPGIYTLNPANLSARPLLSGKGKYKGLKWDEEGNQLAFIADRDTTKALIRNYSLYYWQNSADSARKLADSTHNALPKGWLINDNANLNFAKDGSKLYFGSSPKPILQDTTRLPEEIVNVEVWNWQDGLIQPQQNRQLEQEKRRSYLAVVHLKENKVVQLATPEIPQVQTGAEGNASLALGTSNLPYRQQMTYDVSAYEDLYLIDLMSGKATLVVKQLKGNARLSPMAQYIYWYNREDTTWNTYHIASARFFTPTKPVKVSFADEENDVPDYPSSYGMAGWSANDKDMLLYDRYDIWSVDPQGARPAQNLTANGRSSRTTYRYIRLDEEERFISLDKPMLLSAFFEASKEAGFFSLGAGAVPQRLLAGPYMFGTPRKAKNTADVILTRENFREFPDLYQSDISFKQLRRLSNANPQQADYRWGNVQLVKWVSFAGEELEGLLYTPDDFDRNKQYPMIAYFYERNSNLLYRHIPPTPSPSTIRASEYTSRGYLVFIPDITYRTGYPGQSAYDAIVSGVHHLIGQGFVAKDRIGLQGQSWGGYQTAYLITRTTLFKAAMAGAPVVNMFSAYGGIRWGTGLSRQFQYERTQSRIGGTIWERPLLYMENSPLFSAERVETPLLMMHNDADGAVPWYQGIEYYMALRRLNKPVWMLNYQGEDHNLIQRKNRKDLSVRMQQFFDHYLMDAPAPAWMKKGVPAIERGISTGYELMDEE